VESWGADPASVAVAEMVMAEPVGKSAEEGVSAVMVMAASAVLARQRAVMREVLMSWIDRVLLCGQAIRCHAVRALRMGMTRSRTS